MSRTTALIPTDRIAAAKSVAPAGLFAFTIVVVAALAVAAPVTGVAAAQADNGTATPSPTASPTATPSPTQTACEPSDDAPQLSQSRLYAPQQTIRAGEPGQIAGGFQVAASMKCPVTVSITMSVPSGMTISGSSDIVSSGAGLATAQFQVQPGEIKDIRAKVYSQNTGERTVTADIEYWPTGHKEMSREIDGISLTFNVEGAVTPTESATSSPDDGGGADGGDGGGPFGNISTLVVAAGFGLLVLAIVAIVAMRSGMVKIGVSN